MTEKWDDTWFFTLKPKYKLLWLFILDKCDHAGVWEANLPLASTYLGATYTEEECLEIFGAKVRKIGEFKWLIPKFIFHQYGCDVDGLNAENSAHKGVIAALKRHGIDTSKPLCLLEKPPPSPSKGAKDMDKDKDLDKDKEKKKFAEFVTLTDSEHAALVSELGESAANQAIEILDNYKGSKGKKYVSDYRAIRSWVIDRLKGQQGSGGSGQRTRGRIITNEDIERQVKRLTGSSYKPPESESDRTAGQ